MTVTGPFIADQSDKQKQISHSQAISRAMLAASKNGAKVFRREVGLFYDRRGNPRKIGTPGEADLQGWIPPTGRALAIEIKTGKARRTADQKKWAASFSRDGGIYLVARYSPTEDGDETIRKALGFLTGQPRCAS